MTIIGHQHDCNHVSNHGYCISNHASGHTCVYVHFHISSTINQRKLLFTLESP